MSSWLFFDMELSGHHSEYLNHLVDFILARKEDRSYIFIVHPDFEMRFPCLLRKTVSAKNISFEVLLHKGYKNCKKGSMLRQSIETNKLMDYYARKYNATKVYLLYFNIFQFALCIFHSHYDIIGILFSPFYRMERNTIKGKLEFVRKYLQTWLFIRNRQIKKIFILNDISTAESLNNKFGTKIFQMLPDPVPELAPLDGFDVRNKYEISSERKIFLHFGSLAGRKGTFDILDSYNYLNNNEIKKVALILTGKASLPTNELIKAKISKIKSQYSNALIIYKNEFVSESLMKSYFDQCDVVLVPYKNVESSSGIIGHAVASGKPVIGTKKGLLGDLILKNELGILINDSSPRLIAESIHEALAKETITISNTKYLKEHTTELFASTLLYGK